MKRKAITPAMKIDALLWRFEIKCSWCDEQIHVGHPIEWDHVHALVHGGDHDFTNIRPIHYDPCHKEKTARDIAAKAKGDRILGLTCNGPTKKIASPGFDKTKTRKMPSRPFPKRKAA